jgi:hypothetical protein
MKYSLSEKFTGGDGYSVESMSRLALLSNSQRDPASQHTLFENKEALYMVITWRKLFVQSGTT